MVAQTRVVQVELEKMCRLRDIYTLESVELKVGCGGVEEHNSRMSFRLLA